MMEKKLNPDCLLVERLVAMKCFTLNRKGGRGDYADSA